MRASWSFVLYSLTLLGTSLCSAQTERVSIASGGGQADNYSSRGSASADGRYVVFESTAGNLTSGDQNGVLDVFLRDRQSGQTTRLTTGSGGAAPSISANGRYIAFQKGLDIFVYDQQSTSTTQLTFGNDSSFNPSISADGNWIVFRSAATNLVAGDTNGFIDVFVVNRTGAIDRVSLSSAGAQPDLGASSPPAISGDGRYVAFASPATNLVSGDTNAFSDIFLRDRQTSLTTRISVSSGGLQGNQDSDLPAITPDGRHVAFSSYASNLTSNDVNGFSDVFVHDGQSNTISLASVSSTGQQGNSDSWYPSISSDSRFVAFMSDATNLTTGASNAPNDLFVRDRQTGQTTCISESAPGVGGNNDSQRPRLSSDGRYVVFESQASDLVPGDTNALLDVFIHDRGTPSPPSPYSLGIRSANPATGVPMTVWTTDINGRRSASTSFDRVYNAGTSASVTAPLSVGNQWFERWEKDTVAVPGGNRTITVLMDAPHTIKAVYMTRRTLTVTSQNPNSGVPISVWTVDKNGQSSGNTQFQRTYTQGTTVSLTAPNVVGNSSFRRWNLNGAPWQSSRTVSLPMGADHTLTAVYVAGQTLTVTSATPSVTATVWNSDIFGRRDGTTNFSRIYATGGTASVTVPAQVGGKPFVRWEKDGVAVPGGSRTVTVTMDAGHTINAVYAP